MPPFLHRNKPSRESIFCGKVSDWWTKRALIMLNFLLKTRQNKPSVNPHEWATARKTDTLAAASASGCRACCSQTTGTASWEGRSNWPQTSSLQLVEMPLNNSPQSLFWTIATFCRKQMGHNFMFYRTLIRHVVHVWGVFWCCGTKT